MNFIDYSCGIIGMAQVKEEQHKMVSVMVQTEVEKAIQQGYRYFWLALTGEACLHYATGIKKAISGRYDITLEVISPYPEWINEQSDSKRYKDILRDASIEFASNIKSTALTFMVHSQVLDLSAKMLVVSNGKDKEIQSVIKHIQKSEVPVTVVLLK